MINSSDLLQQLRQKFGVKKKELFLVFDDLEMAFDRVPREAIRWAFRRQNVPERLIALVMALYRNVQGQESGL